MFIHIIHAIFFWQLVNKTADCFNNIVFILVAKISSKKICEKLENNSTLEKVLLICNRNAELLRLVAVSFDSKVANLRRIRKKNLIILKSLQRKRSPSFVCRCWHLSCQISIESVADAVIRNNFWFQSSYSQKDKEEKNLIILKSLQRKSSPCFVCHCWHLSCQISSESIWKIVICLLNVLMTMCCI